MKLTALTIRNYRVHRELTLALDASRTLIGGPNESGKSTIVEALHRVFFLKARGGTEYHRAMDSQHGGEPEVDVTFHLDQKEYRLVKRFGAKGATTLYQAGAETLANDAAEAKLNTMLGLAEQPTGRAVATQWAHLWVRQGSSGFDPCAEATAQQGSLLQRLQEMGGAGALLSDFDHTLAARFSEKVQAIFRRDDKAKAGSALAAAQTAAEEARQAKERAEARVQNSLDALAEYEEATRELTRQEQALTDLGAEIAAVGTRVAQVEALRRQETEEARLAQGAAKESAEFEAIRQRMAESAATQQKKMASLAPRVAEGETWHATAQRLRTAADQFQVRSETEADALKAARQRRDLLATHVSRGEKEAALEELLTRQEKVLAIEKELTTYRAELTPLPAIDEKKVALLRRLETDLSNAGAALEAMAAGLEILATDQFMTVGGKSAGVGQKIVLTEDTELTIGTTVHLRISPGGGTSLAQARNRKTEADDALTRALAAAGVESVAAATELLGQRAAIGLRITTAEQSLQAWNASALPGKITATREALAHADSELARRQAELDGQESPAGLDAAREQLALAEKSLAVAEQGEAVGRKERLAATTAAAQAEERLALHRLQIETERQAIQELQVQLRLLEETHGGEAARGERHKALSVARDEAELRLKATQLELVNLDADRVQEEVARLQRARDAAQGAISDAKVRREGARTRFAADGRADPQADLAFETARAEEAQARLVTTRREAEATRLLHTLFADGQRSLADQFTKPLADAISGYLECLFGEGACADVVLQDNQFSGLKLVRRTHGGGAFPFEKLSGGAQEQVAAAMRLAMAEVLAQGFDGSLPILFDDAFAYADPERVAALQRMLRLAAERGLQVIVFTCTPSDYEGLGARAITLTPTAMARPVTGFGKAAFLGEEAGA